MDPQTIQHNQKKIGEWLLHLGLLTKRQLDAAIEAQGGDPESRLGEILVSKGYITVQELQETLAVQEVLNGRASLQDFPIAPKTLSLLPENFCLQHTVLPLAQVAMRLLVATADSRNFEALDKITVQTGLIVVTVEVSPREIDEAFARVYAVKPNKPSRPVRPLEPPPVAPFEDGADASINELVTMVLEESLMLNATAIHFIPGEQGLEVRCRVDGIMRKLLEIPKKVEPLVVKRLKQLGGAGSPDGRPRAQDPFVLTLFGEPLNLRLSSVPTLWGESLKLDVCRPQPELRRLETLGLVPEDVIVYKQLLRGRGGLILIAGTKGSGRLATLHSTLGYLDKLTNHVIVLEGPNAAPLSGVTQIPLNPKQGYTLEVALEQALEQDPDVIVVGQLRTRAEMEAVLEACTRGIQVIGIMNAPHTSAAIAQWISLGIAPYRLGANLRLILAQRMVRRNCPHCVSSYQASPHELHFLGLGSNSSATLMRGRGCEFCHQTGYLGQVGLFEMLSMSPALRTLLLDSASTLSALEAQGRRQVTSLFEDAQRKVLLGYTSIAEVMRTLGDVEVGEEER